MTPAITYYRNLKTGEITKTTVQLSKEAVDYFVWEEVEETTTFQDLVTFGEWKAVGK